MGLIVHAVTFITDSFKSSGFSPGKYDFISQISPISRVSGNPEVNFSLHERG